MLRIARLPFRYGFDRAVAKRLLKFGVPLAAGLGVESLLLFSDSIIVGHVLGATLLGFYLLAFNVSSWVPGLVGTAVRYVSIPSFSRLAEQKPETFALGVRRAIPLMFTVVMPIAVTMAVLASGDDPLSLRGEVGAGRGRVALPRRRHDRQDADRTCVRHPDLAWHHPCNGMAQPRMGGGAHPVTDRWGTPATASGAPPSRTRSWPSWSPSRWPWSLLQRGGVNLRPVAPALVRPLLGGLLAGLIMLGVSELLELPRIG